MVQTAPFTLSLNRENRHYSVSNCNSLWQCQRQSVIMIKPRLKVKLKLHLIMLSCRLNKAVNQIYPEINAQNGCVSQSDDWRRRLFLPNKHWPTLCVCVKALYWSSPSRWLLIAGINPHLLMSDGSDCVFTYAQPSLLPGTAILHHASLFLFLFSFFFNHRGVIVGTILPSTHQWACWTSLTTAAAPPVDITNL